eukprot:TRINITY_DN39060_c0_g1_i4.p1 TRINITY_DN39060_c0_g1~~TRINITY_DN39060_c0_g1_i4.p1  ORF type:complete len:340 (-),score=108.61 TRINITY_DN39060_c0_g1_i4:117-1136(-)
MCIRDSRCGCEYQDWECAKTEWDCVGFSVKANCLCTACFSEELAKVGIDPDAVPIQTPGSFQRCKELFIQMEYCPNRTLRDWLDGGRCSPGAGPEPVEAAADNHEIWRIFGQIASGLSHIHRCHMVHRDMKPSNIYFDSHMDIKIGDFGLSKEVGAVQLPATKEHPQDSLAEGSALVGTFLYLAPELLQHNRDPQLSLAAADMYALGVILLEIWYDFATAHERVIKLEELRRLGQVPVDYQAQTVPHTIRESVELIEAMVVSDHTKRMTSQRLMEQLPTIACEDCKAHHLEEVCLLKQQRTALEHELQISRDLVARLTLENERLVGELKISNTGASSSV